MTTVASDPKKPTLPATREELEKQTEQLARDMLDAMDRYDDPEVVAEREARERAQEFRNIDALTRFYLETGQQESSDTLAQAVGKMARFFAERVARELPPTPLFPAMTQPLPARESGARVELELGPPPSTQPGNYLLVRVHRVGKPAATRVIQRGSIAELVALLQSAPLADRVIAVADELERGA